MLFKNLIFLLIIKIFMCYKSFEYTDLKNNF